MTPHNIQLIIVNPTLPEPFATPFGEINIPDPADKQ